MLAIAAQVSGGSLGATARAISILVSLVLTAATYALVEEPIRRSPRLRRSLPLTLALAIALILAPIAVARWTAAASPAGAGGAEYQPRLGASCSAPASPFCS